MSLDELKSAVPDYAKDLRLNLGSVIGNSELPQQQLWGTVLACAIASRSPRVLRELEPEAKANLSPEEQAVLNKPVSELNLSVRARKCMNRLGITTLGELCQRTSDELLEAKNFGVTSLTEVKEKLQQYNLKLRGD